MMPSLIKKNINKITTYYKFLTFIKLSVNNFFRE